MAKEQRQSTYDRIVSTSLVLFNQEGERNISTNHIAAKMGISPGNLYYHFRNKDEIIMQLFKRYSKELMNYLKVAPLPQEVNDIKNYMLGVYEVMWDYRFLFSDVNAVLSRSAELLGEHNDFTRESVAPMLVELLNKLTEIKLMHTDAIARRDLSLNMWLVTKYWFDFDGSLREHDRGEGTKYRGVYHTLSLLRPYVLANYQEPFNQMMAQILIDYPKK